MAKKKAKKKDSAAKAKQMKTWTNIIRLAESGLTALDAGNLKEALACLKAVRGVALMPGEERK